jgi:hypothetical protein
LVAQARKALALFLRGCYAEINTFGLSLLLWAKWFRLYHAKLSGNGLLHRAKLWWLSMSKILSHGMQAWLEL